MAHASRFLFKRGFTKVSPSEFISILFYNCVTLAAKELRNMFYLLLSWILPFLKLRVFSSEGETSYGIMTLSVKAI